MTQETYDFTAGPITAACFDEQVAKTKATIFKAMGTSAAMVVGLMIMTSSGQIKSPPQMQSELAPAIQNIEHQLSERGMYIPLGAVIYSKDPALIAAVQHAITTHTPLALEYSERLRYRGFQEFQGRELFDFALPQMKEVVAIPGTEDFMAQYCQAAEHILHAVKPYLAEPWAAPATTQAAGAMKM